MATANLARTASTSMFAAYVGVTTQTQSAHPARVATRQAHQHPLDSISHTHANSRTGTSWSI